MSCDIFIVSCDRDAEWLRYCLRSIQKFGTGFRKINVAIPIGHNTAATVAAYNGGTLQRFVEHHQKFAQVQTLMHTCYKWGCDADHVLQIDSDCHLYKPTNPDSFFRDGKPIVKMQAYSELAKHAEARGACQWQPSTEQTLKFSCPMETMRLPGRMFPRWIFRDVERYVEQAHGMPLDQYICSRPPNATGIPNRNDYAEFNVIGSYARRFHREKFSWHDVQTLGWINDWPIRQKWSYGGVAKARAELEALLAV